MVHRSIIVIICMATFLSVRTVAWTGGIAPELLKELESGDSVHDHAVIIKLRNTVDYQSLNAAAEHMGRRERVNKVEDIASVGDELTVMVTGIDPQGKIRLSRQAVLEGWTLEEATARDRGGSKPSSRPGGNRHGDGRPSGGRPPRR